MASTCDSDFFVGKRFSSFDELKDSIVKYERSHFVKFWIRDSRTVDSVRKKFESRYLNDRLKYYEITYCCIHGGKKFTCRGTGKRSTS